MCGIVGVLNDPRAAALVPAMLQTQRHRGPDFTGVYQCQDQIVLGHNRLSIIDLSPAANQPMHDFSGRYTIVFNGEIYNYLELREEYKARYDFATTSDTEVLLAAYIVDGKDCLYKLNGMFAFAIWDREKSELFVARDRFGVKPFYYHKDGECFYFASEIKTLRDHLELSDPDSNVWANYFLRGTYGMPGETFYKKINILEAGSYMVFSNGLLKSHQWYDFVGNVKRLKDFNYSAAKEHYTSLLKSSIKLRFRSDVPAGINISGGVDSSTLLSFTNQYEENKHLKAFTFYTGDERYDELPWVECMIEQTENELVTVKLTASEIPSAALEMSNTQDEPYGGFPTIAYGKLFEQASRSGIKVLLDGQGMDEQWAGYDYYFQDTASVIQGVKSSPFRSNVLQKEFAANANEILYPKPFESDLLNKQYRDLFYTKVPRTLRFNDRVSMKSSTELREPFLDHRMVEFAFAQPELYKKQGDVQKFMLRDLLKDYVPDDITYAPKRPLQTPQREWLGNELKDWVRERIESLKNSHVAHWFDFQEMEIELEKYFNGNQDSSFHIWQWVNTSLIFEQRCKIEK
jgi:asparagine synthase (glutamine-hydrolysing)